MSLYEPIGHNTTILLRPCYNEFLIEVVLQRYKMFSLPTIYGVVKPNTQYILLIQITTEWDILV